MASSSQPLPATHSHPIAPQSSMSFSMTQPSSQPLPGSSFARSFSDQTTRPPEDLGKIYTAVYSGVDVYEMEVNGIAVMRRRNDMSMNATQILKVAGVDKGKRTKILEKEIQTGEHEKVQGGYGKYQGTWISFERAKQVCRQYGVEELLHPLLTYDTNQDGSAARRPDLNTPTKEQAMAAQRKRLYNSGADNRNANGAGTFFKNISSTAHTAVAAISKARFDSPGPRGRNGPTRAPSFNRQSSLQSVEDFQPNSQASNFQENFPPTDVNTAFSAGSGPQPTFNGTEPPRKRQRMDMTPANSFGPYSSQGNLYSEAFPGSPTEPNDSFIYNQHADGTQHPHDSTTPLPPLLYENSVEAMNKRSMLMSIFSKDCLSDEAGQEILRSLGPRDIDSPIDTHCHTALHWAATLSRMAFLRPLIAAGASPFRVNTAGETPLMRACMVTNSHENNTMPEILEILGHTIEVRDNKGRTVLHHIALSSAVNGRSASCRYYLQCLLTWVVKQGGGAGSQPSSQNVQLNGGNSTSSSQQSPARMDLARFMSEMVNAQDDAGDTALNISARIGNRSIISQLIEVCADPRIANRAGLKPVDFGVGENNSCDASAVNGDAGASGLVGADKVDGVNSQKSRESSDDIVTSITHLLTETSTSFQQEIKNKQQSIDSIHQSLRSASSQLTEARRRLEEAQAKVKARQLARQKVANLTRARDQEQYRLMQLEQRTGRRDVSASSGWDTESNTLLAAINATTNGEPDAEAKLPSAALLRARIEAVKAQTESTRQSVVALKGRSREVEGKYRHLVALASKCADEEVDPSLEGLLRAVESEKGELEIGRVRRFLGGVEGAGV